MTHDNSWPVALKFMSIGASKIHDNKQVVMTLDHDVQNKSETNLKKYKQIEAFAQQHGVDFFGAGRGIGHQIMVEEGYAWPGTVTVASDSHSNMYGGVGCLGTPVVRTDAASIVSRIREHSYPRFDCFSSLETGLIRGQQSPGILSRGSRLFFIQSNTDSHSRSGQQGARGGRFQIFAKSLLLGSYPQASPEKT